MVIFTINFLTNGIYSPFKVNIDPIEIELKSPFISFITISKESPASPYYCFSSLGLKIS